MAKVKYTAYVDRERLKSLSYDQEIIDEIEDLAKKGKYTVPWAMFLKGEKGEFACVEGYHPDDLHHENKNEACLNFKYPLSLEVEEQRKWVALASKFFKPLINPKKIEVSRGDNPELYKKLNEKFEKSKKTNPDLIFKSVEDGDEVITFYPRYSDSLAWGSRSGKSDIFKKRDAEMGKLFWSKGYEKYSVKERISRIKQWLEKQSTWLGLESKVRDLGDVAKEDIIKVKLDWDFVYKKLNENGWSEPNPLSPNIVCLKIDPETQRNQMSKIFGDKFSIIFPILKKSYRKPKKVKFLTDGQIRKICYANKP